MKATLPLNILIVEDDHFQSELLKENLEQAFPNGEITVIDTEHKFRSSIDNIAENPPDLVVMDIGLPVLNGIDATSEILRHCPSAKVTILSMYDDENSVVAAFRSGARAFLLKNASSSDLLDALRTVSKGGSYLSSQVSDHLLTRIQRGDLEAKGAPGPLDGLSPRERQVLRLVAEGKTSKDVATMLDLGLQTVRTYRKTLMKKIGVTNVASLTQVALGAGLTGWGKTEQKT